MLLQRFDLPTGGVLTAYLHESSPQAAYPICEQRPALIVCPGGGYEHIAFREKDPPAMTFLHMGMQVFALEYDLSEKAKNKKPLEQLARSIQLVRKNSKQWNVDPNRIFLPEGIWQPVWASIGTIRRFWPGVRKKMLGCYALMA